MLFVLLAALCVGSSTLLAWSYPIRVARLCTLDGRAWKRELGGLPNAERVARLRRAARVPSWEAELGGELAAASDDRGRALAFNDAVAHAEHLLDAGRQRPRAGLWLALATTAACAVAGYLSGARRELAYLIPIVMVGAASCVQAARSGRRRAAAQRANVDALVAALAGELATRALDLPERRRMRWQRRR